MTDSIFLDSLQYTKVENCQGVVDKEPQGRNRSIGKNNRLVVTLRTLLKWNSSLESIHLLYLAYLMFQTYVCMYVTICHELKYLQLLRKNV